MPNIGGHFNPAGLVLHIRKRIDAASSEGPDAARIDGDDVRVRLLGGTDGMGVGFDQGGVVSALGEGFGGQGPRWSAPDDEASADRRRRVGEARVAAGGILLAAAGSFSGHRFCRLRSNNPVAYTISRLASWGAIRYPARLLTLA